MYDFGLDREQAVLLGSAPVDYYQDRDTVFRIFEHIDNKLKCGHLRAICMQTGLCVRDCTLGRFSEKMLIFALG